jgi:hypothetical protein
MSGGWSSLIQLGLALALPWLLQQIGSWLKKNKAPKKQIEVPYTRLDSIVRWTLLAMIVYQLVYAWLWPPPNLLGSMRVGAAAPSFRLRNKVWEYTEKRWTQTEAKQVLGEADVDGQLPYQLERLRLLYKPLKDQPQRVIYLKYGEAAFLTCGWCQDGSDYLLYIFPSIAFDYFVMFAVLMLATETRRKRTWWTWAAVGTVAIGLFVDMVQFASSDEEFVANATALANVEDPSTWSSAYSTADRWRRTGFAILSLLVLIWDGSLDRTENEIAREIVGNNQITLAQLNAFRLQQNSVLSDDALRRTYVDFYRRRAIEADLVTGNEDYERVKKEAVVKQSGYQKMTEQEFVDKLRVDLEAAMNRLVAF